MKRFVYLMISLTAMSGILVAQTLQVQEGHVTYLFSAPQTGVMPYANGTTLRVQEKVFALSDITSMRVDETPVPSNKVSVMYKGSSAAIVVSGNIAQYLTITQTGAHVSIVQSDDVTQEITYTLSGSSDDGEFYTEGSCKTTIELNNLTLTNSSPVYSGAAIHVQNGKRIKVKPLNGTVNTLADASSGSQKGALYAKGHIEFAQNGTLNVTGNLKHGIKAGEYISIKNATVNVLAAAADGINCEQYFLMESGVITITGAKDDGIQCDIEESSTGERTDHEGEDSGNMYFTGGTVRIACQYKGIKASGNLRIEDGDIQVISSGTSSGGGGGGGGGHGPGGGGGGGGGSSSGSSPEGIEAKGTIVINGGFVFSQSSDDAINAGGDLTINGGHVCAYSTSNDGIDANGNCYIKGGLIYAAGSRDPEVAIDANTEQGKKLYIQGGILVAVGKLEGGAQMTQTCYQASGATNTWYAMSVNDEVIVFKTPGSNASTLVMSGAVKPTLYKGVTPSGTAIFNNMAYYPGSYSGGTSVTLSTYSSGGGGGWW